MIELSRECVNEFLADIGANEEYALAEFSEEYGDSSLSLAIDNGDFNAECLIEYLMGDDSQQFLKSSLSKQEFDEQLSEILAIHERISEAEVLVVNAVRILMDYNRRIDNSFDTAMSEFWANTCRNPRAMLIELIEESIREC